MQAVVGKRETDNTGREPEGGGMSGQYVLIEKLEARVKELEAEFHQTTNMLIACQTSILHNESCNKPTEPNNNAK